MKMKDKKAIIIPLIFLFMLLLLLSLLLLSSFSSLPPSTFSFPSSSRRSLKKKKSISDVDEKIWMQHHDFQKKKERKDIEEIADYTGTGANNHHDPGSPPATTS